MFSNILAFVFDLSLLTQPLHDTLVEPLPPGALMRLGTTRFGHLDPITWVGFAPDGKTVLTADSQARFRFWDAATGRSFAQYRSYLSQYSFAMSSDKKVLALSHFNDATMTFVDVRTRKEFRSLSFDELFGPEKERYRWHAIVLSPNGRFLAVWESQWPDLALSDEDLKLRKYSLAVWDLHNRRRLRSWKTGDLCDVEFSPDCKTLAAFEWSHRNKKNRVRFWDVDSDDEIGHVELPFAVSRIVYLPNGNTFLGVNADRTALHLFEKSTGKSLRAVVDSKEPIAAFALSPDGTRLALSHGGRLVVKELENGKVAFDLPHSDASGILARFRHHNIDLVAFSPDGTKLVVANGRNLEIWDIAKGTRWPREESVGGPVLAVHAHGRHLLARDMDMNLSLWDLRTGKLQRRFVDERRLPFKERPFNLIRDFFDWAGNFQAISPDGHTIAALWLNGPICLLDLPSGKNLQRLEGSEQATCLAFSASGKHVAGPLADGRIGIWDVVTGKRLQHLTLPADVVARDRQNTIVAIHFSADGRTLTAGNTDNAGSWDVLTWELATSGLRSATHGREKYARSGYHPGGLAHLDELDNVTLSLTATPDGKHLAAAGRCVIRLLDSSGKETRRFGGRDIAGQSAAFSPDGKYLAAGLDSGGVRIWDAKAGTVLRDVPAHAQAVTSLTFVDQGKTLVTGSLDGTALVWNFSSLLKAPAADAGIAAKGEFEKWWTAMSDSDGAKANQAMQSFVDRPAEACAFFKMRVRPVPIVSPPRIAQLVGNLQSDQFPVRQRAMIELEQLGGQARSALADALAANPPFEGRRRIESLMEKLEPPISAPHLLQAIRAVEVLERIGTSEARQLLAELASGGPGHRLTEDARDAALRLSKGP